MLPISLLFTALAVGATVHLPIHLQPHPMVRRSTPVDGFAPFKLPVTQKQDTCFLSPSFSDPSYLAAIAEKVADNQNMLSAALAAGKAKPPFSLEAVGAMSPIPVPIKKRDGGWNWATSKIRGVNLGGWLVLEPYMTPSLFNAAGNTSAVDEWSYSEGLGYNEAYRRLADHWATWITEQDIKDIAAAGLNHVRIPIGFWAFDVSGGEPYVQGQYPWLLKAIGWCQTAGLRVIVDLHGAPGSQNGFDNSGRRGATSWHTNDSNINRTMAIIHTLGSEFEKPQYGSVITALQLLNEPAGFYSPELLSAYKKFAYDSYGLVRFPTSTTPSPVTLSLHDAFEPLTSWNSFMPNPDFTDVSLDTHIYTIFSNGDAAMSQSDRIQSICKMKSYLSTSNANLWTIVGEWSPAITDCATSLNGRGSGSRYDGTYPGSTFVGSCAGMTGVGSSFSDSLKSSLRQFWEVQVSVYEASTSGYVMWSWKTENADDWSWQAGLKGGWIPQDPTARAFPDPCI